MHVDWDWIEQRPHYIAKELSKFYEVTILYGRSPRRHNMVKNSRKGLTLKTFFPIPFYLNNGLIYKIHKIYLKRYFKYIIKKYDPDYIWITFPILYNYLPCDLRAKIIYDCMDDALGFSEDKGQQDRILEMELKLITNSWKIFSSSKYLANKLMKRKECSDKLEIVPNAFDGNIIHDEHRNEEMGKKYKIGYFGTVSSWLDFESLKYTLKHLKNIEYHIIGPLTTKLQLTSYQKENIKFYGSMEHNELFSLTENFDCLILPFNLNELIYSVDPVKLYEYINFNKPIISVYYEGLKRFESYTYFYTNKEELLNILEYMVSNGFKRKYSSEQRIEFLNNNTWEIRGEKIRKALISEKVDN